MHDRVFALERATGDDALAARIARECKDLAHDDRWCPTCEARSEGIEDYRRALLEQAGGIGA